MENLSKVVYEAQGFDEKVFLEHLKEREIILNTVVDDMIIETCIMQILRINKEDENIIPEKRKPIKIYINTNGGDIDVGLVLCNVIQQSLTPVYTIALGKAYSMGGLVLIAGHKRFAYEFTSILIHDGSLGIGGSTKKVKETMNFYNEMEDRIKKFILDNTKYTEELYDDKYGSEFFMYAKQAKELGIIDYIIGEKSDVVELVDLQKYE